MRFLYRIDWVCWTSTRPQTTDSLGILRDRRLFGLGGPCRTLGGSSDDRSHRHGVGSTIQNRDGGRHDVHRDSQRPTYCIRFCRKGRCYSHQFAVARQWTVFSTSHLDSNRKQQRLTYANPNATHIKTYAHRKRCSHAVCMGHGGH